MPETSMTAGFYHIPDKTVGNELGMDRQLDDRGDRPPVALPVGDQIEVGGAPVLDERGAGVPASPPVHLLDIAATLATGRNQVPLLPRLLGHQPHLVGGPVHLAEGTAQLGE